MLHQIHLTQRNKARHLREAVRPQMMRLQAINFKNSWKKGLAGSPNPLAKCEENTTNSPFSGFDEISSGPGARAPTSSIDPRNLPRGSLRSSAPSTQEPLQAPELAIDARFPVER